LIKNDLSKHSKIFEPEIKGLAKKYLQTLFSVFGGIIG
jgi:hypothetical protein